MRYTRLAEAFHVLPRGGGLFDQLGTDLAKMEQVLLARDAKEEFEIKQQEGSARLEERTKRLAGQ
jgi:hypothetical protein